MIHHLNGATSELPAVGGIYTLDLRPAGDFSYPDLESTRSSAIGGEPIILVESPGAMMVMSLKRMSTKNKETCGLRFELHSV